MEQDGEMISCLTLVYWLTITSKILKVITTTKKNQDKNKLW
jgi:hypothetical protein